MAGSGTETRISLKILVDKKANKVVFAETGEDFVDFILQMMSLPLSIVTFLLKEKGMAGCLGDLYKSVEDLNVHCFHSTSDKISVFRPRITSAVPLLGLCEGSGKRYAKEGITYMVMDNLEIKPMSISLIRSLVKDFDFVGEKQVQFGLQEGLALLKASLEKQAVLTTVFCQRS